MKLSTKGRLGKNNKTVRVETNDAANAEFNLQLTGEVKAFVAITPPKALLIGNIGEPISQVVTAVPDTREPSTILRTETFGQGNFRYTMKETEVEGKKAYQFLIENIRTTVGTYSEQILLFTDRMDHNPIIIPVIGNIRPVGSENSKAGDAPSVPGPEKK